MTTTIETKFFTVSQNNSGGIFDHDADKGIGYKVCVEAVDQTHAKARMREIIDSYPASHDCPCCGERWFVWFDEDDGTDAPESYGKPLVGGWGIPSYIHYIDGRIEPREPEA